MHRSGWITIIVPVLNEAGLVELFLRHLRERAPEAEIVVVDGGSTDGTAALADGWCDQLLRAEAGRAIQLNAGAEAAHGDILWFLHVDSKVPSDCLDQIRATLDDPRTAGGFFRIRVSQPALIYRFTDSFAHYAGLLLRLRCGDHGFFCRRESFWSIGGYPELPIMEDIGFYRRLRRRGKVRVLRSRLETSARRYKAVGSLRLTCLYGLLALLYAAGVPARSLAGLYQRHCQPRKSA